jgi:hypothetical protein
MPSLAPIVRQLKALAVFAIIAGAGLGASEWLRYTANNPTPERYMMRLGADASFVPAGALTIGGQSFTCGRRPALLVHKFEDYAASLYGFLIVNPERFGKLPPILQRYAYTHECGHQFVGWDEEMADCYAIRRGREEGWLDARGMEEICAFIGKSKGDITHPAGVHRCQIMRRCFKTTRPGKEPGGDVGAVQASLMPAR